MKSVVFWSTGDGLNEQLAQWLESEKPTHLVSVTQSGEGCYVVLTIIYS